MLTRSFFFIFILLISGKCFSQNENENYKNEISIGANPLSPDESFPQYSLIYKRNLKNISISGSFNAGPFNRDYLSNKGYEIGGSLGIIKYPDKFKIVRWKFFYGAECLFFYDEYRGKYVNVYETNYGLGFITGAEFRLTKHFSLASHINPMYYQSNLRFFQKQMSL